MQVRRTQNINQCHALKCNQIKHDNEPQRIYQPQLFSEMLW